MAPLRAPGQKAGSSSGVLRNKLRSRAEWRYWRSVKLIGFAAVTVPGSYAFSTTNITNIICLHCAVLTAILLRVKHLRKLRRRAVGKNEDTNTA
jgi:hypothetical protein